MRPSAALLVAITAAASAGAGTPADAVFGLAVHPECKDDATECVEAVRSGRFRLGVLRCGAALRVLNETGVVEEPNDVKNASNKSGSDDKSKASVKKDGSAEVARVALLLLRSESHERDDSQQLALDDATDATREVEKLGAAKSVTEQTLFDAAHARLAVLQRRFGDFGAAARTAERMSSKAPLRKGIISDVEAARSTFETAKQALDAGNSWKRVADDCSSLIADRSEGSAFSERGTGTPYMPAVYDMRVRALLRLDNLAGAVEVARQKARIETDRSETDFLIAKLYLSAGNVATGRKFVNECARLNPENRKCMALRSRLKEIDASLEDISGTGVLLRDAVDRLERMLVDVEAQTPADAPYYDTELPTLLRGFRLPVMRLLCVKQARRKLGAVAQKTCDAAAAIDDAPGAAALYTGTLAEMRLAMGEYDEAVELAKKAMAASDGKKTKAVAGLDVPDASDILQKATKKQRAQLLTKHYDVLGVSKDAGEDDIKRAYNRLVRQWHPDKQSDEESRKAALSRMHEINNAYEVLSDSKKRAAYDAGLDANGMPLDGGAGNPFASGGGNPFGGAGGNPFGGAGGNPFGGGQAYHFNTGQGGFRMEDFAQFFGGAAQRSQHGKQKGRRSKPRYASNDHDEL